jgi:hypothetical protein
MSNSQIGYRAHVALAADDARPDWALHVEQDAFTTKEEARAWIEPARGWTKPSVTFAASLIAVYGKVR